MRLNPDPYRRIMAGEQGALNHPGVTLNHGWNRAPNHLALFLLHHQSATYGSQLKLFTIPPIRQSLTPKTEETRSRPMKNQPSAEVRRELIAGATLWTTSGENSERKNPGPRKNSKSALSQSPLACFRSRVLDPENSKYLSQLFLSGLLLDKVVSEFGL